jgi:hypothetical protein
MCLNFMAWVCKQTIPMCLNQYLNVNVLTEIVLYFQLTEVNSIALIQGKVPEYIFLSYTLILIMKEQRWGLWHRFFANNTLIFGNI